MLNKWIAPLIVVAVLVLASCNDMDGDGEDDTSRETARRSAMEPNDPEPKTDSPPPREPVPPRTQDVTPEPPSFTGLVGSWRFIDDSFDKMEDTYDDQPGDEPTHDTLTFGSDESFMRVEKRYAYASAAMVPHPYPEDDSPEPEPVTGAWLELPDSLFTLEGAKYEVKEQVDDQSVSQVTITRVTTEEAPGGGAEVKASVTCDFEIVATHHTPPIRYLTLANCKGDADVKVPPGADVMEDPGPFALLAKGVPNGASSRDVKVSTDGLSYNPSYSYRFEYPSE